MKFKLLALSYVTNATLLIAQNEFTLEYEPS